MEKLLFYVAKVTCIVLFAGILSSCDNDEDGLPEGCDFLISEPSTLINGVSYTDLGLSKLWATYPYNRKDYGYTEDYFSSLEADSVVTNENLTLPSYDDILELMSCEVEAGYYLDLFGYKITGPNGNSIFIEASAGRKLTSTYDKIYNESGSSYFWSSNNEIAHISMSSGYPIIDIHDNMEDSEWEVYIRLVVEQ